MQQGEKWNFKKWIGLPPGQLEKEINAEFKDATPGVYYALVVNVENPITGYQVIKKPV
jgi:hypothetical protein